MSKAWEKWGLCEKKYKFLPGDRVRLAAIMCDVLYREDIEILLGIICKDAAQLDGAIHTKDAIWARLAVIFNDNSWFLSLPESARILCKENDLDPNDFERRAIARSGKWLEKCWQTSLPPYKESFRKWTSGTGGGPSQDQLFAGGWADQRSDGEFRDYDNKRRTWLAVLYILDKANGLVLLQRAAPVPDNVGETGMGSTTSTVHSRTPTTMKKGQLQMDEAFASFKETSKTVNDLILLLSEPDTNTTPAAVFAPVIAPVADISRIENRLKKLDEELEKAYVNQFLGDMKATWIQNLLDQKMKTLMQI